MRRQIESHPLGVADLLGDRLRLGEVSSPHVRDLLDGLFRGLAGAAAGAGLDAQQVWSITKVGGRHGSAVVFSSVRTSIEESDNDQCI
jgi:hypothetical protein